MTLEPIRLADGVLLLDASTARTADAVRDAQTQLAEYRLSGHTTVHVAGALAGEDARDDLDALGRRTVRLNIHHLVVVGDDARILHLAAEHEGSWDGESLHVSTVAHAYDVVQRLRGDAVVVLVTGSVSEPLAGLVERWKGENA